MLDSIDRFNPAKAYVGHMKFPLDKKCLTDILNMSGEELERLYSQFRGRVFGHNEFGFGVSGLKYLWTMLINFIKKLKK